MTLYKVCISIVATSCPRIHLYNPSKVGFVFVFIEVEIEMWNPSISVSNDSNFLIKYVNIWAQSHNRSRKKKQKRELLFKKWAIVHRMWRLPISISNETVSMKKKKKVKGFHHEITHHQNYQSVPIGRLKNLNDSEKLIH